MPRYPTLTAPQPSQYDKLFLVKPVEAFKKSVNFINSSSLSERRIKSRSHSQEAVAFVARDGYTPSIHCQSLVKCADKKTHWRNQSKRFLQIRKSHSSSLERVALPGLFDAELRADLTEEDRFLGPMKRVIVNKDVTSFNKLGSYMSQCWTKAAVVNDCVIMDNKLAIPELLRKTVLARLHRARMSVSEYLWWPFLNQQIFDTCEKYRECTLFGKNLKPTKAINTAHSFPTLSGPNQAGSILDEKDNKIFLLVAIDRFSKFPSFLITKVAGAKKSRQIP